MIHKITEFIEDNFTKRDGLFLSVALIVFAILRFPSIFEPYWYGDEGIYEVLGMAIRSGRVLYSQIWDNKPPILYLIYAIFNGDLFYVRLASFIVGLLSVFVFFLIVKKLFKNYLSIIFSTLFFAVMFGLPIIEGNIANAENFMILPTLISFYLLFCIDTPKTINKRTIAAGLILSISFLTKIVALFDFTAFATAMFAVRFFDTISFNKKSATVELKKLVSSLSQEIVFTVSFIIPILLTFAYFIYKHAFADFWRAAFSQNVGYVGYGNYFLFPMGFLVLKLLLLAVTILIAFRFRQSLTKVGFIIIVWVAFALFDSFFSNRPYTHYLIVLLPAVSLLIGFAFEYKKLLKITIPLILIVYLLVNSTFSFYKKNIPYYQNFISFISGGSVEKYQNFFDGHTSRDYDVATWVKNNTNKSDTIFLWGDGAQIYALSDKLPPGRYAVSYHITFYKNAVEETKAALAKSKPRFIIQTKDDPAIENFLEGYVLKYKLDDATIYERKI